MTPRALRTWRAAPALVRLGELADDPDHPIGKVHRSLRERGLGATVREAARVLVDATARSLLAPPVVAAEAVVRKKFSTLAPLPVHTVALPRPRISLVTDTINPPHLYGGVGTALLFAALLAERLGHGLRIITRHVEADPQNLDSVLRVAGLAPKIDVEYAFSPSRSEAPSLPTGADELFITTSWWTTHGALTTRAPERILYLLQEDERMFYAGGDEHLRCSEVLASPGIRFLINSRLLFDHMVRSGLANLAQRGSFFEPSFPIGCFHDSRTDALTPPYRFLFYARPNNARNLFYRGIEALEAASRAGLLKPEEWELYLVGKDIPRIGFSGGPVPQVHENLSWLSYAELVRRIDLGMSLMYTPHPSYPPLDLAASGAVVVTNRFAGKDGLDQYSRNILCSELGVADLVRAIAQGVELAKDRAQRRRNYQDSHLLRDWRVSFADALDRIEREERRAAGSR